MLQYQIVFSCLRYWLISFFIFLPSYFIFCWMHSHSSKRRSLALRWSSFSLCCSSFSLFSDSFQFVSLLPSELLAAALDPACAWKVLPACDLNASHLLHWKSHYLFALALVDELVVQPLSIKSSSVRSAKQWNLCWNWTPNAFVDSNCHVLHYKIQRNWTSGFLTV